MVELKCLGTLLYMLLPPVHVWVLWLTRVIMSPFPLFLSRSSLSVQLSHDLLPVKWNKAFEYRFGIWLPFGQSYSSVFSIPRSPLSKSIGTGAHQQGRRTSFVILRDGFISFLGKWKVTQQVIDIHCWISFQALCSLWTKQKKCVRYEPHLH